MIKLLIVDDEQIEREGLQAILQKGFPDLVIEQARNGKAAVQMAEHSPPDLILMDIKMPGMNGLEAVEQIGATHPDVKFIMVTAYDTFEFAQQAIRLGVKDYLLKPSKARDIVATVGKVLDHIAAEREAAELGRRKQEMLLKALPVIETDIVTQLLFDHVHEVHLDELVELLDVKKSDETFVMVVLLPSGTEGMYAVVKEKIGQSGIGLVGALNGRQIPVIMFRCPGRSYRAQAASLARELLSIARGNGGDGWFIGIGGPYRSWDQIRQSYQEALIASMDVTLPVKYRLYEDTPLLSPSLLSGTQDDGPAATAKQLERQLQEHIRLGQWERLQAEVTDCIRRCENEGADVRQTQQRVLELLWTAARALHEIGVEAETPLFSCQSQDYRQLGAEAQILLERMRVSYSNRFEGMEPDTIQRIRRYIMEHSHEPISLDAIGKKVGFSSFYISKMFKEQIGVNYIDFLTECRIEKAKKLMSDPEKSLKEITFEVGYHDPNYFSKVFRKMCGASPTEYRRTLLGKKG